MPCIDIRRSGRNGRLVREIDLDDVQGFAACCNLAGGLPAAA
jgi:hypothetical protein